MAEFVEEPLYQISLPVKPVAEGRRFDAVRHGADVCPCAAFREPVPKGVGVISPIRQKDVARPHGVKHIHCAAPVMGLAFGKLEGDGQTHGIDQGVDLGRQTASRATHATGSDRFLYRSRHADGRG